MNSLSQPEDLGAVKFSLSNYEWQYRGEGNAKIAITLLAEKKIVLLHKSNKNDDTNICDFWNWMSKNIKFVNTIMKSILGEIFVSSVSLVYFSSGDIQHLNKTVAPLRPEKRKEKEVLFSGGELCDDHVYLPPSMALFCQSKPLCIELKPKQGVFPDSERHFRNCLFCRKQKLKMKHGIVCHQSLYCPLDLFSGSCARMKSALLSLLRTPQNNLRIYYDGNIAFGENHSDSDLQKVLMEWLPSMPKSNLMERFSSILLQALTKDMSFNVSGGEAPGKWKFDGVSPPVPKIELHADNARDTSPLLPQPSCNYDRQELPKGCILHSLAQAQALDNLGTALVYDVLKSREEYSFEVDNKTKNTNYVCDILNKGCSSKLNPIECYLIAAVARDCSILITLQEMKENSSQAQGLPQVVDEDSRKHFLCHIAAVDLGPKPISCIYSQMKKKALILKACQQPVN